MEISELWGLCECLNNNHPKLLDHVQVPHAISINLLHILFPPWFSLGPRGYKVKLPNKGCIGDNINSAVVSFVV